MSTQPPVIEMQKAPRLLFVSKGSTAAFGRLLRGFMAIAPDYTFDWIDKDDEVKKISRQAVETITLQASCVVIGVGLSFLDTPELIDHEMMVAMALHKNVMLVSLEDAAGEAVGLVNRVFSNRGATITTYPANLTTQMTDDVMAEHARAIKAMMEESDQQLAHARMHTFLTRRALNRTAARGGAGGLDEQQQEEAIKFLLDCAAGKLPSAPLQIISFVLGDVVKVEEEEAGEQNAPASVLLCSSADDSHTLTRLTDVLGKDRAVVVSASGKEGVRSQQMHACVAETDVVALILSEKSRSNPECLFAMSQALNSNKRVLIISIDPKIQPPAEVSGVPIIHLPDGVSEDFHQFQSVVDTIIDLFDFRITYLKRHTRFSLLARQWIDQAGKDQYLLSGEEMAAMEALVHGAMAGFLPPLAPHHIEFFQANRVNESKRPKQSEEGEELEEEKNLAEKQALNIIRRFNPTYPKTPHGRQALEKSGFIFMAERTKKETNRKKWVKRYMVVYGGGSLHCYGIRVSTKELFCAVDAAFELTGCSVSDCPMLGMTAFSVSGKGEEDALYFRANSEAEKEQWTTALRELSGLPFVRAPDAIMEGYLLQRQEKDDKYELRYFVLLKHSQKDKVKVLKVFILGGDPKPQAVYEVTNRWRAEASPTDPNKFNIFGGLRITCQAKSEDERDQWLWAFAQQGDVEWGMVRTLLDFTERGMKLPSRDPHQIFNKADLLEWLEMTEKVANAPAAVELAQNMLARRVLRIPTDASGPSSSSSSSSPRSAIYTAEKLAFGAAYMKHQGPSVVQLLALENIAEQGGGLVSEPIVSSNVEFLVGSRYEEGPSFAVFRTAADKLYFYHDTESRAPHLRLDDVSITCQFEVIFSKANGSDDMAMVINKSVVVSVDRAAREMWVRALRASCAWVDYFQIRAPLTGFKTAKRRVLGANEVDTILNPPVTDSSDLPKSIRAASPTVEAIASPRDKKERAKTYTEEAAREDVERMKSKVIEGRANPRQVPVFAKICKTTNDLAEELDVIRGQVMDDVANTELVTSAQLADIIQNVLFPIDRDKQLSAGAREGFASFCKSTRAIHAAHTEIFAQFSQAKSEGETAFLLSVIDAVKQVVTYQEGFSLKVDVYEELSEKLPSAAERVSALMLIPSHRVAEYVFLLERLLRCTPAGHPSFVILNKIMPQLTTMAGRVEELYEQAVQLSRAVFLDSQVWGVPDEWCILHPERSYTDHAVLTYLLGSAADTDQPPAQHPVHTKREESVRAILFSDTLLLTTFKYKYRYRIDLSEVAVFPKHKLHLVLAPEMFDPNASSNDSSSGGGSSSPASPSSAASNITTLLCGSQKERDIWLAKIQRTIDQLRILRLEQTRKLAAMGGDKDDVRSKDFAKINLFLRVRPFVMDAEKELNQECLTIDGNMVVLDQTSSDAFRPDRGALYDKVFGPECDQPHLFAYLGQEVLGAIISGYSVAVMAYGNTGAGKTHTMFGDMHDPARKGLIPRLLEELFEATGKKGAYVKSQLQMAYLQVYNDKLQDLLNPKAKEGDDLEDLPLKDSKKGVFATKGLTTVVITSAQQALQVVTNGNKLRATRAHKMNEVSSRSHAVFVLEVSLQRKEESKPVTTSVFLVDLAGSENVSLTGVQGDALLEAKHINKSLISIGRVINALVENKRRTKGKQIAVPFRESKITQVLGEALTQNFVCSLILHASLSPALGQAHESAKTIAFGEGAKKLNEKQGKQEKEESKLNRWLTAVWTSNKAK